MNGDLFDWLRYSTRTIPALSEEGISLKKILGACQRDFVFHKRQSQQFPHYGRAKAAHP